MSFTVYRMPDGAKQTVPRDRLASPRLFLLRLFDPPLFFAKPRKSANALLPASIPGASFTVNSCVKLIIHRRHRCVFTSRAYARLPSPSLFLSPLLLSFFFFFSLTNWRPQVENNRWGWVTVLLGEKTIFFFFSLNLIDRQFVFENNTFEKSCFNFFSSVKVFFFAYFALSILWAILSYNNFPIRLISIGVNKKAAIQSEN